MVQRKAPNKVVLQSDHHVKSLNQTKGTSDLKKKKMKKSGSIKRPELDAFRSPSLKKPPPNYMKPTSSSDARKEQSQLQSQSPVSLCRKSSSVAKVESCCSNKSTKTSVKTSSLKMMRSLTRNPSFKPAKKATCSSTLKDCKFPDYLNLNPEGTSTIKVCPYTYCSLNGHRHRDPLPPLKCFLSTRRRAIKNIKLGCFSPRNAKPSSLMNEEKQMDFVVEIYCKNNGEIMEEVREERAMETLMETPILYEDVHESLDENRDVSCMDIDNIYFSEQNQEEKEPESMENSIDNIYFSEQNQEEKEPESMENSEVSEYDYEYLPETEVEPDPEDGKDEFVIDSDNKGGNFNEFLSDDASQESFDEESFDSDAFSTSDNGESTDLFDYMQSADNTMTNEVPLEESEPSNDAEVPPVETITSSDQGQHVHTQFPDQDQANIENSDAKEPQMEVSQNLRTTNAGKAEAEDTVVSRAIDKRKKLEQDIDESGLFNPRAPNFLPIEADPEAEKVDLRHQDLDERKNAEEWMVDYALRKVVTKLGPARKRKVALLVEAFEKVMPVTKCDIHLRQSSDFDQARTMQACS